MKVVYKKLGRHKAFGITYSDEKVIYVDPRTKGKKRLEILLHEGLHQLLPQAEEEEVIRLSVALTKLLWAEKFRLIDDDCSHELQDGTL